MRVPVHVIAGFLGAGKTTTLLGLLKARPGERIAVVVNDFGEAAIDASVLGDATDAIASIEGACVCCTAPAGFTDAVGRLLDDVRPDRIVVEPTGLARPADLVDTLERGPHRDRLERRPTIVVVDPSRVGEPLVREQIEAADVLVANRVDVAKPADLAAFRDVAGALWPGPITILETSWGRLPPSVLDWPAGTGPRAREDHDHDHDHDLFSTEGFVARSRVWPPDVRFSRERLAAVLRDDVVRVKGLFRTEEGAWLVEVAGGRLSERPSSWRRDSRVDVIATSEEALDVAESALDAAVLRPEELHRDGTTIEVVTPSGRTIVDRDALKALPDGVPDVSALVPKRQGAAARVAALLDSVDAPADADVVVVAVDGLATAPVPVSALRTAVLVHSLGDGPLPADQGGPFRLLIPGDAGPGGACANVKGVAKIVVR